MRATGRTRITSRLNRMPGPEAKQILGRALFAMASNIVVEAQLSITRGSVSGKNHKPSLPGQPPNQDTGVLANNIEVVQLGPLKFTVASNAPYATHLELGTSKMAARPYMGPAKLATEEENRALFERAVQAVARGT